MDETGADYTEWSKPERKTPMQYITHIYGIYKDGNDDPVCETAKETQMCRADFWSLRERERVGWFGRMALKQVYYLVRNESPVYVRCRIQDALDWCTGMNQRDVMGKEVGGEFMLGNACTPMVDSCQCMAKPIQYCKVK